jgi:hypothetical protein
LGLLGFLTDPLADAFFGDAVLCFDRPACVSALAAAAFDVRLVRLSRKVFDAAFATFLLVVLFGDLRWDNALPAAVFDGILVDLDFRVLDAAVAAFFPVTLVLAMKFLR